MNKEFNGDQLKSARLYRGMTVEELANKIGLQKQSVSLYENGKVTPDFEKILKLINALDFPYDYFMQKRIIDIVSHTTYFRALLKTSKKYRTQQIIKMEHLAGIYQVISEYIEFPELSLPNLIDKELSSEEAALKLREFWELGNKPIKSLVSLLEDKGVVFTTYETPTDEIDAFSHLADINGKGVYFIALSTNKDSAARTHFNIAHELGHILLHEWSEDIENLSREEFKEREREANEFAANFLLPKHEFLNDIEAYPKNLEYYTHLKKKWRVSISAMIMRAHNLKVITYNQYQYMMRVMNAKGYRTKEPLDNVLITNTPVMLNQAIDVLLNEKVFTLKTFLDELKQYGIYMHAKEIETLLGLEKDKLLIIDDEDRKILKLKPRKDINIS